MGQVAVYILLPSLGWQPVYEKEFKAAEAGKSNHSTIFLKIWQVTDGNWGDMIAYALKIYSTIKHSYWNKTLLMEILKSKQLKNLKSGNASNFNILSGFNFL